jgi:transcriptional regulator
VFIPASFRIDDRDTLLAFIERYGFATLVSTDPNGVPFATHVPLLLDRSSGLLLGHIATANPQWEMFTDRESLAVFHGPHAYVSPTWYATAPAVPTWNYAAVHVYGTPRVINAERTGDVIDRLVSKYESHRPTPWTGDIPDDYRKRLLAGVVGFAMPLTRIEGKAGSEPLGRRPRRHRRRPASRRRRSGGVGGVHGGIFSPNHPGTLSAAALISSSSVDAPTTRRSNRSVPP